MGERMTPQLQIVLRQALAADGREWFGREMAAVTGLPEGTVYPMLARMVSYGWVAVRVERPSERATERRPARRYHSLTAEGAAMARSVADAAGRSVGMDRTAPVPWPEPNGVLEVAS